MSTVLLADKSRASCISETKTCAIFLLPLVQKQLATTADAVTPSLASAVATATAVAMCDFEKNLPPRPGRRSGGITIKEICSAVEGGLGKHARRRGGTSNELGATSAE